MTPEIILLLVQAAVKYGPDAAISLTSLFEKETVTVAEVREVFAKLKRYSEYGIPDKAK